MPDALEFLVQSLSVACYLAEIPLDADELLSGTGLCILYDVLGQAHLPGKFEGKRVARQSHLQLEHRSYVLDIEHHGSVHHPGIGRSIELEVGVMRGDDAIGPPPVQFAEDGLCNRPSGSRLRT